MSDSLQNNPGPSVSQQELNEIVKLHKFFLEGEMGGRRAILKNTDMSDLSLRGQDLRQADFTGCNMSGMDLHSANFQEASLYACNLSDCNLSRACFIRADLRGALIENANLEGADLEKADLRVGGLSSGGGFEHGRAAVFRGANMSSAKLCGSMANKADFSDAMMAGVDMTSANCKDAQFEGTDLSDAEIEGAELSGANIKSAIVVGVKTGELSRNGLDLSVAVTEESINEGVSELEKPLTELIESHKLWVKSAGQEGEQLDLSNIDLRPLRGLTQEKLTAIKALNAKFFGMNLYKIQIQSGVLNKSDFRNCDMEEADVRASSFEGANFSHASLRTIDASPLVFGADTDNKKYVPCSFKGANFKYAVLAGGKFYKANFRDTDLSYADFSNADIREADFRGANLKGAKFENAQTEGAQKDKVV